MRTTFAKKEQRSSGVLSPIASTNDVKQLGFSNFEPWKVRVGGISFPTLEHAYQAAKTEDPWIKRQIAACATPGQAKRMGNKIQLPDDWQERKVEVMARLLRFKFRKGGKWASLLAQTVGDLVEYTTWHDTFWGVCICRVHAFEGENMLGRLLTKIREDNA